SGHSSDPGAGAYQVRGSSRDLVGANRGHPGDGKRDCAAVARSKTMSGDALDNAISENVRLTVQKLSTWTPLAEMVKAGDLQIVGAVYHLDSGRVIVLDESGAAGNP